MGIVCAGVAAGARLGARIGAAEFGPIVDGILHSREINVSVLPDDVERELYMSIVRLLLNIAAAQPGLQLDCFGVHARMALR